MFHKGNVGPPQGHLSEQSIDKPVVIIDLTESSSPAKKYSIIVSHSTSDSYENVAFLHACLKCNNLFSFLPI